MEGAPRAGSSCCRLIPDGNENFQKQANNVDLWEKKKYKMEFSKCEYIAYI